MRYGGKLVRMESSLSNSKPNFIRTTHKFTFQFSKARQTWKVLNFQSTIYKNLHLRLFPEHMSDQTYLTSLLYGTVLLYVYVFRVYEVHLHYVPLAQPLRRSVNNCNWIIAQTQMIHGMHERGLFWKLLNSHGWQMKLGPIATTGITWKRKQ